MADTTISPKPRIKCYVRDNMLCEILLDDTAEETLEKVKKLTAKECTHHVDRHCTARDRYDHVVTIYCNGNGERCNCGLFRTRSMRIVNEEEDI